MHIAVISMVRNEADIIESFVRHAASFADRIYIVNHNSTDETRKILDELVQEGLPLKVEDFYGAAQAQSEVMTDLMRRAFGELYDFVLPLDADEFLLPDGEYDMNWCREALFTACTPDKIYQIPWVIYQTANEYAGKKFILAEECYREVQPESLGKLLLGRLAFEQFKLILSQGNHHALVMGDGGMQRLTPIPLQGIHLAHFSWRSCEQAASKAAVGWLANVAKYSKQTNLANHWRQIFNNLLEGKMPVRPVLKLGRKAVINLKCQKIPVKYAGRSNNSNVLLRNVLLAAQKLANDYSEEKVRIEQHKVSVIMPYLGQRASFEESFVAALQEEYPYVNMIVFSLAEEEEDAWLLAFLQQQTADSEKDVIYLQEREDVLWKDIALSADGEFIQWIFPGDLVEKCRLQHMVTTLVRHENIDLVLTNSHDNPALKQERDKGNIVDLKLSDGFAIGDGNIYRGYLSKNNALLSGGLSSPLFRRKHMERLGFFKKYMQGKSLPWQVLWQAVLKDTVIGAMSEPLVEMHSQL